MTDKLPAKRKNPETGPEVLTVKMKKIIYSVVYEGMELADACQKHGYQRRAAHRLMDSQVFKAERDRIAHAVRSGEAARSLATLVEVRDNRGDGSAARDTARIKAAVTIMGEHKSGISVTVNNQNNTLYTPGGVLGGGVGVSGQPTRAGYLVDLREDHELDPSDPGFRPLIDVTPTPQPALRHASGVAPAERSGPSGSVLPAEKAQHAPAKSGPAMLTIDDMKSMTSDEIIRKANPGWFK